MVNDSDDLVEGGNDSVDVSRDLAHLRTEAELEGEEVEGSDEVAHETSGGGEELVSVLQGLAEVSWEHSLKGGDRKGNSDEGDLKELLGGCDVAIHIALEVWIGSWGTHIIINYKNTDRGPFYTISF